MSTSIEVGDVVAGKYRVERVLARGGFGLVVAARHLQLLEPCAIKVMLPHALLTPLARARFLREAQAAARIKNDHVVRVFDVGQLDDGRPYIVMEYLEGCDLEEVIAQRGRIPVAEAATYLLQSCEALAEAHALGIVHRDLKPANLFLTRARDGAPRLKILDFGISKVLDDPIKTAEDVLMGSPFYMAPEQIRGKVGVDARADVWALGVILYQLVTGRLPFEGDGVIQGLFRILSNTPEPPTTLNPEIPPELERVILRCLEKDREARPAGVADLAADLAPFAELPAVPLSARARRVFESTTERLPPPPPPDAVEPAAEVSSLPPAAGESAVPITRTRSVPVVPSRLAVARLALVGLGSALALLAALGVTLSRRAPASASLEADGAASEPAPAAPPEPTAAATVARSVAPPPASPPPTEAASASASASAHPAVPPAKRPRSVVLPASTGSAAAPLPPGLARSAGFDMGKRQ